VQLLDHPDATVVEDSANTLREHGSVETKEHLWLRLGRWNKTWEGREKDLRYTPNRNSFHEAEARLEGALTRALAQSRAWVLSARDFERLAAYCVTKPCRQNVKSWQREQAGQMHIITTGTRWHVGSLQFGSWAALLDKVGQFPSGSRFSWSASLALTQEEERRLFAELERVAAAAGLQIIRH
jgi:hypothetical protein